MTPYVKVSICLALFIGGVSSGWHVNGLRMNDKISVLKEASARERAIQLTKSIDKERAAQSSIDQLTQYAQSEIDKAKAAANRSSNESDRLRKQVAIYTAAARANDSCSPNAGKSQHGSDPLDLLSDMLSRSDGTAGELAIYADELKIRGSACEKAYSEIEQAFNSR